MNAEKNRIVNLVLDERTLVRRTPEIEKERAVAINDILEESRFSLNGGLEGPYNLYVSIADKRLVFDVRSENDAPLRQFHLSLTPFRRLVKDYYTICDSYYQAIRTATPSQIEAIDMGRRGVHNEGSELLQERLLDKVTLDHDTARRLFTLICVLHIRG